MRPAPATYSDDLLTRSALRPICEVTSWLSGRQIGGPIPVKAGTVTDSAADAVSGQLDMTVPNTDEWRPGNPETHPLGWWGQQLRVRTGWADSRGRAIVWCDLGRFRIRKPVPSGDVLQVRGDSLEQLVLLARFVTPTVVKAKTYKARVQELLRGILPVSFDPQLADRSVKEVTYDRERLDALSDTLAAWPASLRILSSGVAFVGRPLDGQPTTVQATYSDGPGGTVVDISPEAGSEDDVPNACVVSTEPTEGKVLTEAEYTTAGPLRWGGPYGYVPAFYSSPLLTTRAQCKAAAKTRLANLQQAVQQVTVTMLDDPRLERGDIIRAVSTKRGTDVVGRITTVPHGMTAADRAESQVVLSVLSGRIDGVVV